MSLNGLLQSGLVERLPVSALWINCWFDRAFAGLSNSLQLAAAPTVDTRSYITPFLTAYLWVVMAGTACEITFISHELSKGNACKSCFASYNNEFAIFVDRALVVTGLSGKWDSRVESLTFELSQ